MEAFKNLGGKTGFCGFALRIERRLAHTDIPISAMGG
jgi:hypothetical protein